MLYVEVNDETARRSRVSALAAEASGIMRARVTTSTSPIGHTYTYILTSVLIAYESLEISLWVRVKNRDQFKLL